MENVVQSIAQFVESHPVWTTLGGLLGLGMLFGFGCSIRQAWENRIDRKRKEQGQKPLYHMW